MGLLILWISLFGLFTFLVFFVIGLMGGRLVNTVFKWLSLFFLIISLGCIIWGIVLIKKNKKKYTWKKIKKVIISSLLGLYAVGCCSFLFILYGPFNGFRDWLITTAMATMNHHYYCEWFYSDKVINEVLNNNYIDDGGAESDSSLIDHNEDTTYDNEYEEQILNRDKDALYKIIEFQVNDCNAYLGVVYDASKISVGVTPKLGESGYYIYRLAELANSVLTINGGGFIDENHTSSGGNPVGVTISKGKVITDRGYGGSWGVVGFDQNDTLVLTRSGNAQQLVDRGIRDAVTMGPFLIVNGNPSFVKGNGGWGYAARTAIGQRKDGIVLFLVVDSDAFRRKGASMKDLVDIMQRYGAVNAANLDGGTSSVMVVEGEMINDPIDSALKHKTRPIPTVFNVVE